MKKNQLTKTPKNQLPIWLYIPMVATGIGLILFLITWTKKQLLKRKLYKEWEQINNAKNLITKFDQSKKITIDLDKLEDFKKSNNINFFDDLL